jgi:hypothetical protein
MLNQNDLVNVPLTLSGKRIDVDRLISLLALINASASGGHSIIYGMAVSGSDSDSVAIEGIDDALVSKEAAVIACAAVGGFIEYVGANGTFYSCDSKNIICKNINII